MTPRAGGRRREVFTDVSAQVRTGESLRRDSRFAEYVARFNAGRFFAAHEVLEELWLEVAGAERDFLQGLVQIAVALEHRARGNGAGAAKVLARARGRLRGYGPRHAGLPLATILAGAEACIAGRQEDPPRLPTRATARNAAPGPRREPAGVVKATKAKRATKAKKATKR
jgi:hypothetical protein